MTLFLLSHAIDEPHARNDLGEQVDKLEIPQDLGHQTLGYQLRGDHVFRETFRRMADLGVGIAPCNRVHG